MAVGSPSGQQISVHSDGGSGHYGKALAIVTTLFFMWGFLTSLNDILVPHLKEIFDLNYAKAALVQFAFFFTYFVFALPSGKVVEWIGYKRTMVAGLFVMAAGAFLFVPAASAPSFPLFLTALVVLAAGVTMLQVAANPYVTVLGPARTASSRLNLTQAFNSLGTTIAPKFGSVLILSGIAYTAAQIQTMGPQAYKQIQAASVKLPYIGIGVALVFLAVAIAILKLPRIQTTREFRPSGDPDKPLGTIWQHRHVWLGAIGIFTYVGAEVAIGSFLVNYFSQPNTGAMNVKTAAGLVSFYWGGAMVGRFIGRSTAAGEDWADRWHRCHHRVPAGGHVDAEYRLRRGLDHAAGGALQLHHVPQHLHARAGGHGAADRQSLRADGDGGGRRSDHPGDGSPARGPHRAAPCLHSAGALLRLRRVLRIPWFPAHRYAGRAGRGRRLEVSS